MEIPAEESIGSQGDRSATRWLLPLTALLVAIGYLPGIRDPANALRWAFLSVLVPLLLVLLLRDGKSGYRATPAHWMILGLLAYALASMSWALSFTEALNGWWQLFIFCGCIVIGSVVSGPTLQLAYRAFTAGLLLSVAVALLQIFDLPTGGVEYGTYAPAGLFVNSQLFGEISALGFLVAPVGGGVQLGLLLGLLMSTSRASMIAVAITGGILYAWAIRKRRPLLPAPGVLAGILGIAVGLFFAFSKSVDKAAATQDSALGLMTEVSSGRWLLWQDTLQGITFFGHGIGSYFVEMPRYLDALKVFIARPEHAENEFLHFAFELGIPGVLMLGGIFAYALIAGNGLKARLAALALLMVSCFGFALHMPATVFLGGLVLGDCLRRPEPDGAGDRDAVTADKRVTSA